jgi:hypothetical protein
MRTSHDKSGAASGGLDRFALWRLAPRRGRDFTEVHAFGGLYGQPSRAIEGHHRRDHVYADHPLRPHRCSVEAGRRIAAAAGELGISCEWASKIAHAPETQQIVAMLVQAQAERVWDLFEESLNAIARALRARRRGLWKGEVVDLGPDHYARLAAVARLVHIPTAGRALPQPAQRKEERRTISMEELEALIEQSRKAGERGEGHEADAGRAG